MSPSYKSNADRQNDGSLKLFAMLFYLFLVFMLIFVAHLSEGCLGILMLWGVLYNYGIRHKIHRSDYFRKNKTLIIILLAIFTLLYFGTVVSVAIVIGAYWVLVGRNVREAPYFLKFHILTALIFNFFLLMPYLILNAVISLVSRVLVLLHMMASATVVASVSGHYLPLIMMGLLAGAALWLSVNVLMGRTPYIGVVTDNVRHLA